MTSAFDWRSQFGTGWSPATSSTQQQNQTPAWSPQIGSRSGMGEQQWGNFWTNAFGGGGGGTGGTDFGTFGGGGGGGGGFSPLTTLPSQFSHFQGAYSGLSPQQQQTFMQRRDLTGGSGSPAFPTNPFAGGLPTSGGGMNDLYRNFYDPGMTAGRTLLEQGIGFNPYPESTISPLTGMQRAGMQGIAGLAREGNPMLGPAMGFGQNLIESRGLSPFMQQMLRPLGGVASGQNDISGASLYNDMFKRALGGMQKESGRNFRDLFAGTRDLSSSEANLADMGSGRYLEEGNPYANSILDEQMKRAAAVIESDASRKGREGSPYAAGRTAEELGFIGKQFAQEQYERDKNLMLNANQLMDAQAGRRFGEGMQASGALGNLGQQLFQNQMGALQGRTGLEGQNISNQMQAAMGGLQGAGAGQRLAYDAMRQSPILGQARYGDMNQMLAAGGQLQGQQQSELSDEVQRWLQAEQAPWSRLGGYMNALQGGSGLLGNIGNFVNQRNTMQAAQPNGWQQLLGGLGVGASALGGLFGSPMGGTSAFGGLTDALGGMGGLF